MKYTKQKIVKEANKHGITIEDTGMAVWYDCQDGYIFAGYPGIHYRHVYYEDGRFTKSEVWEIIWLDIKDGVEKCNDPECEHTTETLN